MRASSRPPVTKSGYGIAWLRAFLARGGGVDFDDEQTAQVAELAERKLLDLFDVAEETALANGRRKIFWHDLPITKGLRGFLGEIEALAAEVEPRPVLLFLADAGAPGSLDEVVRDKLPRLMAALMLLSGRLIALLEPANMSTEERLDRLLRRDDNRPTQWELERAVRALDMTL